MGWPDRNQRCRPPALSLTATDLPSQGRPNFLDTIGIDGNDAWVIKLQSKLQDLVDPEAWAICWNLNTLPSSGRASFVGRTANTGTFDAHRMGHDWDYGALLST